MVVAAVAVGVGVVVVVVVGVGVVVVVVVAVGVVLTKENTMRKIVEEVSGEGLDKLIGERVTLFCLNYIYTGKLTGVNETCVLLSDAAIVYETGPLNDKTWKDAQALPGDWYVQRGAIESFGILK